MNPFFEPEVTANLKRAKESIRAAQLPFEAGHWDFAAARAYYASFYAATAALLSAGHEYQKHSGVIAAVHKFLVKTGKLDKEHGKNLNWLFLTAQHWRLRRHSACAPRRRSPGHCIGSVIRRCYQKTLLAPGIVRPKQGNDSLFQTSSSSCGGSLYGWKRSSPKISGEQLRLAERPRESHHIFTKNS
jgi:uncharacterized protein (UPF0332 family)